MSNKVREGKLFPGGGIDREVELKATYIWFCPVCGIDWTEYFPDLDEVQCLTCNRKYKPKLQKERSQDEETI